MMLIATSNQLVDLVDTLVFNAKDTVSIKGVNVIVIAIDID